MRIYAKFFLLKILDLKSEQV